MESPEGELLRRSVLTLQLLMRRQVGREARARLLQASSKVRVCVCALYTISADKA